MTTDYPHRRAATPESDGLCSYVITLGGLYVKDTDIPGSTCQSPDDAQAFLWPASCWADRLVELKKQRPWLHGTWAVRSRP